ncbi:MAG: fused response regulator/phosphatase [Verrucomicrobiota bacterium]|jgi:serine phosphatase RsbU (regulator of sigma subunit)|nr:fused response regulator/phosphatase [Verrucomicrobiota bacterium]
MSESLRALIIEDSALDAKVLVGLLQAGGYKVTSQRVETAQQYVDALNAEKWDIILADYNLPEFDGPEGLRLLQESCHDIPFIVISGGIGEDLAVQIMKSGAHDYLMKGNLARLVPAVEREVREARERIKHRKAEAALHSANEQMHIAREIQQRLFPKEAPKLKGYDLAGLTESAEETAGDYYDFIPMPDNCTGLVVGDVTGHGIGPALLMAETRAYLRILAGENTDVGQILTRANRVLNEDIGSERFVTLLFVMLNPKAETIRYASAGHPPGLWLDGKGNPKQELTRTGIPLGLRPDTEYQASDEIKLEKGDLLALMSDGVEESLSAEGELFGKKRIMKVLVGKQSAPAARIVAQLHKAGRAHEEADQQPDDFTTIVLKVK